MRGLPGVGSIGRLAVVAIAVWVLLLMYISFGLVRIQHTVKDGDDSVVETVESLQARLDKALQEMLTLQGKYNELTRLAGEQNARRDASVKTGVNAMDGSARLEREVRRVQMHREIEEVYFYLAAEFRKVGKTNKAMEKMSKHALNQLRSLLATSLNFSDVSDSRQWRNAGLRNATALMQRRIHALQNPKDCSKARKLVCTLNKGCGFGCQLHHVAYCFVVAYGTRRTMVLQGDGLDWRYAKQGWTAAFLPITSCPFNGILEAGQKIVPWTSQEATERDLVVSLPIVDSLTGRPPYLPLAFPKDLADQLLALHSYPPVWFIAQFIWYLMRSSSKLGEMLAAAEAKIPFKDGPIVGVQIRRTDKVGTEAAMHTLDEYMEWVEHWFVVEEMRRPGNGQRGKRRVFIATDEPKVVDEAREKYKDYAIYADSSIAQSAQMNSRYSDASLFGVITDIHLLSRCDYLVCTFSSQVCRMGYELMQVYREDDAGSLFHSLDDIYYYGGQHPHDVIAVQAHVAENGDEIDLNVGDTIGIAGNHWNGFSKGTNRRTQRVGLFPSYKTREQWRIVDFPTYADVQV